MQKINVLLQNKPGTLSDILELLSSKNINVHCLDVECLETKGVLSLLVDDFSTALAILKKSDFKAVGEDVVVVSVDDKPGELAKVTAILKNEAINIRSAGVLSREGGKVTIGIVTENNERARSLFDDEKVVVL
jgi:hypothetical protein